MQFSFPLPGSLFPAGGRDTEFVPPHRSVKGRSGTLTSSRSEDVGPTPVCFRTTFTSDSTGHCRLCLVLDGDPGNGTTTGSLTLRRVTDSGSTQTLTGSWVDF